MKMNNQSAAKLNEHEPMAIEKSKEDDNILLPVDDFHKITEISTFSGITKFNVLFTKICFMNFCAFVSR